MIEWGTIWLTVGSVQYELMLFAMAGFLIIGCDELALDSGWLVRTAYRRLAIYRLHRRATASDLVQPQRPPRFALFIPAWDESGVIASTVARAAESYRLHDTTIFVGCYPNDDATPAAVTALANDRLIVAHNALDGPTTKADCLNAIWRTMLETEAGAVRFDVIVLHDAEDHVDSAEPLVFAALYRRFAMIQLPVVPFASPSKRWIGSHYCDEFAEAHLKAMVLREALGAALPSAGVGCAIRRDYLDARDLDRRGLPFGNDTLTEDYELGVATKDYGLPSAFVRIRDRPGGRLVATRAQFPHRMPAAVRQKAR